MADNQPGKTPSTAQRLELLETAVKRLQDENASLQERLSETRDHQDGMNDTLHGLHTQVERLVKFIGADESDGPFYEEFRAVREQIADMGTMLLALSEKVEGRNKSAPTKRNMTDADALRVLNGDMKDVPHKEAAEEMGLTYAQVYSCRLEYTFKHVHADLRKSGFKNQYAR